MVFNILNNTPLTSQQYVFNGFTETEVRLVQLWNAFVPILVTELGIVTEVRPIQVVNALAPIDVTEFGIVTEVRLVQLENALVLILVTDKGIVYDVLVFPIGY